MQVTPFFAIFLAQKSHFPYSFPLQQVPYTPTVLHCQTFIKLINILTWKKQIDVYNSVMVIIL